MTYTNNNNLSSKTRSGLLSIGIPLFNEEAHIEETLCSLQSQDYPDIEILISDNASTDKTIETCKRFAKNDSRVKIFSSTTHKSATWNFQNVLSLAHGEFFMWAGAHDCWHPTFASSCISVLKSSHESVSAYPKAIFIDQQGKSLGYISTKYDTYGKPKFFRPWLTALSLSRHYAYPIYGVHKLDAIKQVTISNKCIGPDVVALFELAFLGSTIFIPGKPTIEMRKNADFGDWPNYLNKIYGTKNLSFQQAVQDMINAYTRAIRNMVPGKPLRALHYFSLLLYTPVIIKWARSATKKPKASP